MGKMISACGVICSDCPAYKAASRGVDYQEQVVAAWHRIYQLNEIPEHISCGGCLGTDEELFYTSRGCLARTCCQALGFTTCAECKVENCLDFEKAQSVWDEVPEMCKMLLPEEFERYARPYCDHRQRLQQARSEHRSI